MTIGDILAVIAAILAIAATWDATILLAALCFPAKVTLAQEKITTAPGRTFLRGFLTTLAVAIVAAIINASHSGPTRVVAGALWSGLLILSAVGSAGIVKIITGRIESTGSQLTGFTALTRATALYVAAGFLPVVGWFAIAPVAFFFSVGAASNSVFAGKPKPQPIATEPPTVSLPHATGVPS
jgi:hypothetical protein